MRIENQASSIPQLAEQSGPGAKMLREYVRNIYDAYCYHPSTTIATIAIITTTISHITTNITTTTTTTPTIITTVIVVDVSLLLMVPLL